MKLKPYACSISANYGWADHRPLVVWATSKEKAKALALTEALRQWPVEKHYTAHRALVLLVPAMPSS